MQSVVANYLKKNAHTVLDHPGIETIRSKRIKKIVLLDDSMGSGDRVAGFIERMMNHKSFLSLWSYGKVRIEVLSYARTFESETRVLDSLIGSVHHKRVYPAHTKIRFHGHIAYKRNNYSQRWGHGFRRILDLCDTVKKVRRDRRRGYGETIANVVFYHSVPNNIPGVFWFDSPRWNALFPRRTFPSWLDELLEGKTPTRQLRDDSDDVRAESELLMILSAVQRGVRNEYSIAWNIGLDRKVVANLMLTLRSRGLLTIKNRLTNAGRTYLRRNKDKREDPSTEFSLYIPKSWCAGRETVQPTGLDRESGQVQSESETGLPVEDGESGMGSLERTDAKTAPPSLSVMTQVPSTLPPRERHDRHGPFGSSET
uniref:phosphoribosyltransferase-like protein n=1 Tax=Novipirellula galeiformis TaxID=2528004 RepID=UPI0011B51460|nr:hypothetical protein [Novipirellula galeiformis]